MSDYLKHDELVYSIDFLTLSAKNADNYVYDVDDKYLTKFYKFPILRFFKKIIIFLAIDYFFLFNRFYHLNNSTFIIIVNTPLESNKLSKIRVETEANSIYKYRYENPLFSVKKKTSNYFQKILEVPEDLANMPQSKTFSRKFGPYQELAARAS